MKLKTSWRSRQLGLLIRQGWRVAASAALIVGSLCPAGAHAASNTNATTFELDGNLVSTNSIDWKDLFDVASPTATPTPKSNLPAGYSAASFVRDFTPGSSGDSTTFSTGSKDTLNISSGWQCGASNNIGDKVDLLNAYAVAYRDVDGHSYVFFGLETASNEGTRDVGFWFLKDGTAGCPQANGGKNVNFTGNHQDGDLLVTAEYTGSGVSKINVFRWNGGATGSLSAQPYASGSDCSSPTNPYVCGTTNRTALQGSAVPWLTQTKTSNPSVPGLKSTDLDRGEFFEGGLDLTGLGLTTCFGKFLADTRSSATPNATLFDFTVGNFATCSIGVSKSCDVTRVTTDAERNATGKNFYVTFSGFVTNTGGSAIPSSSTISVVDNAGTPDPATSDDVTITPPLPGDLAPGDKVPFSGHFFSNQNPPSNTVNATAMVSGTAIKASSFTVTCSALPLSSALTVTKNCGIPAALSADGKAKPGTELVLQGGVLAVNVNVSGQVCNTSPDTSVPYLSVSAGDQLGLNPALPPNLGTSLFSGVTLVPGACQTFTYSYQPSAADGFTSPASLSMFTDTVNAIGTHPALTSSQYPTATGNAHCPLCTCTGSGCTTP